MPNIDDLNIDTCHLPCCSFEWTAGHPEIPEKMAKAGRRAGGET